MAVDVVMVMTMLVVVREMDVEFHAGDGGFLLARDVQVVAVQLQFLQLPLKPALVHAQVEQGGNKHVPGDAAKEIEVKSFHTKALIWLAE
jgi:hypothetical protein